MDREKIIKAFEICDNNEDGIVCNHCPYKEDKWNGAWEDETGKTCFQTLHADVLVLLKEQEAVEPKKFKGYNPPMYTIYEYECEKCKSPMMNKQPFCMGCGRSVSWK